MPRYNGIDGVELLETIMRLIHRDVARVRRKYSIGKDKEAELHPRIGDKLGKYALTIGRIMEIQKEHKTKLKEQLSKLTTEELASLLKKDTK